MSGGTDVLPWLGDLVGPSDKVEEEADLLGGETGGEVRKTWVEEERGARGCAEPVKLGLKRDRNLETKRREEMGRRQTETDVMNQPNHRA